MKIDSTLIIGAGGIGSHLAVPLARLLHFHADGRARLRIVDGDTYEERNLERQMFDADEAGHPKAAVLADSIRFALPLLPVGVLDHEIEWEHGYVNSDVDAASLMLRCKPAAGQEGALLVCLCVDNDATRRLFYDAMEMAPKGFDIVVLDCGNDLETSTVVASFWRDRQCKLTNPVLSYENLKNPADRVPGGGCQAQAPSTPQLMVANMAAALSALMLVQAMLDNKPFTDVVLADVRKFSIGIGGGEYGS